MTVRHGPRVKREHYEDLDQAIEDLRSAAEAIRAEAPLQTVSMLRDFEPHQQVKARLELSTGGFLRSRDAGVDVMGDGTLVPFRGGLRRTELEAGDDPFEAVRQALGEA